MIQGDLVHIRPAKTKMKERARETSCNKFFSDIPTAESAEKKWKKTDKWREFY